MANLREPMQGKRGVKNVDGPRREKPPVEGARNAGSEVGAVVVGGEALLHAAAVSGQRREELEEGIEVISGEIGEKRRELRRVDGQGLEALYNVLYDDVDDVNGVAAAAAAEIHHHERHFRRVQMNSVQRFF